MYPCMVKFKAGAYGFLIYIVNDKLELDKAIGKQPTNDAFIFQVQSIETRHQTYAHIRADRKRLLEELSPSSIGMCAMLFSFTC